MSDFIVLESRFVAGMKIGWMKGDLAKVPFVETISSSSSSSSSMNQQAMSRQVIKEYRASIVNISFAEKNSFLNSPWECLEVKWIESETIGR